MYEEFERRSHVDVFPGMMFYFREAKLPCLVLCKEHMNCDRLMQPAYVRFLLLSGNRIFWHIGNLYGIRRIADPVWEERYRLMAPPPLNGCGA